MRYYRDAKSMQRNGRYGHAGRSDKGDGKDLRLCEGCSSSMIEAPACESF